MNPTTTLTLFTEVINRRGVHHDLNLPQNVVGRLRANLKRNQVSIDRMHEILHLAGYKIAQPTLWIEK